MKRKTTAERIAELERKKQQVVAKLTALSARERSTQRKRDTRRKIVVGAAVLAHAELDPEFRERLHQVLQVAVSRPVDRQVIADLLPAPTPNSPSPGATRVVRDQANPGSC